MRASKWLVPIVCSLLTLHFQPAICDDTQIDLFIVRVPHVEQTKDCVRLDFEFEYRGPSRIVPVARPHQWATAHYYSQNSVIQKRIFFLLDAEFIRRQTKIVKGTITIDGLKNRIDAVEVVMAGTSSGKVPIEKKN
jgi:hypothetical protein